MNRVQLKGVLRRTRSGLRTASFNKSSSSLDDKDDSLDRPRRSHVDLLLKSKDELRSTQSTLASSLLSSSGLDADELALIERETSSWSEAVKSMGGGGEEKEGRHKREQEQRHRKVRPTPPAGEPSSETLPELLPRRDDDEKKIVDNEIASSPSEEEGRPGRQGPGEENGEEEELSDLSTSDSRHRRHLGRRSRGGAPTQTPPSTPSLSRHGEGRPSCSEDVNGEDSKKVSKNDSTGGRSNDDNDDDSNRDDDEDENEADVLRLEMEALRIQMEALKRENERLKKKSGRNGTSPRKDAGGKGASLKRDGDEEGGGGDDDALEAFTSSSKSSRWERYRWSSPPELLSAAASDAKESSERPGLVRNRSCMSVRTLDESLHSHGLSRHGRSRHGGNNCKSDDVSEAQASVGFDRVEVRHYPRRVGDNPCVNSGPPVSIGWEHDPSLHSVVSVDLFERHRQEERREEGRPVSGAKVKILTRDEREDLLKDVGHSRKEITVAVRDVERQKRARRKAIHNVKLDWFDEGVESAGRKLKRLVLRKKKDSALYEKWRRTEERERREQARAAIEEENEAAAACRDRDRDYYEAAAAGKSLALSDDDDSGHLINGYSPSSSRKKAASKSSFLGLAAAAAGKSKAIAIEEDSTHCKNRRRGVPRRNSKGATAA